MTEDKFSNGDGIYADSMCRIATIPWRIVNHLQDLFIENKTQAHQNHHPLPGGIIRQDMATSHSQDSQENFRW